MRGRKRPFQEKVEAVGIALLDGASEASRRTGIPRPTIVGWAQDPEFDELRQRTKEVVTNEWWAVIQKGVRRVDALLESSKDIQKVATSTAIIADKMLLLQGAATSRTETLNVTDGLDADTKRALRERLVRAVRGESDVTGAGSDPVGTGAGLGSDSEGQPAPTDG